MDSLILFFIFVFQGTFFFMSGVLLQMDREKDAMFYIILGILWALMAANY